MHFTPLCLLASALVVSGAPNPLQVSVTVSDEYSSVQKPVTKLDDPGIVKYDDSRIEDYPDKKALAKAREFFEVFTNGEFDAMKALQSENYTMTDIREHILLPDSHGNSSAPFLAIPLSLTHLALPLFFCSGTFRESASALTLHHPAIGQLRLPRDDWYQVNKQFTSLLDDLRVIAISIDGDAEPGSFTVLEHLVLFTLKGDVTPEQEEHMPPNTKAGDKLGMINVSVLWWGENGIITKELEYGRITWKDFDLGKFDEQNAAKYGYKVPKVDL